LPLNDFKFTEGKGDNQKQMKVVTLLNYAHVGLWLPDKTFFLLASKKMGNLWKR